MGIEELRCLGGGSAGLGVASEGGEGAGVSVGWVGRAVARLGLADGAHRLGGGELVRLLFKLEHLRDGEGHEDKHDRHNNEELDEGEAFFCIAGCVG